MTQFRSRGKGSKRKVYPLHSSLGKKRKRTVAIAKVTYKQEVQRQQRKDIAETERAIKLLKREYVEDLKDFRKGNYPNTTLNEIRADYLRELNQLQKRLKNPYPRLVSGDPDNYGP